MMNVVVVLVYNYAIT